MMVIHLKVEAFYKLNCNYLHHDSDCIMLVKKTIQDFKAAHKNTECNPNIIWDSLNCTYNCRSVY